MRARQLQREDEDEDEEEAVQWRRNRMDTTLFAKRRSARGYVLIHDTTFYVRFYRM